MRENILLRFNEHQNVGGIQEYSIEVSLPGKYNNHVTGASQVELMEGLIESFEQLFIMFDIPQRIQKSLSQLGEPVATTIKFVDSDGAEIPVSGFAATAKASFEAEVYRNGVLSPPEDDHKLDA
jgi:hypothetical protein